MQYHWTNSPGVRAHLKACDARTIKLATLVITGAISVAFACNGAMANDKYVLAELNQVKRFDKVRAVVEAVDEATIVASLSQRLTKIPKRPGVKFKKGEHLVSYDCTELNARHTAAKAVLNRSALELKNKRALRKLAAIGRHEVKIAQSEVNRTHAEAKVIAAQILRCNVAAPFDGQVAEVFANAHETPAQDAPLLSIVSNGALELRIIVPSNWLAWIAAGTALQFTSDDTSRNYPAKIVAIAGKVDPVSQTIQVVADVENVDGKLLPGMSGDAIFFGGVSG